MRFNYMHAPLSTTPSWPRLNINQHSSTNHHVEFLIQFLAHLSYNWNFTSKTGHAEFEVQLHTHTHLFQKVLQVFRAASSMHTTGPLMKNARTSKQLVHNVSVPAGPKALQTKKMFHTRWASAPKENALLKKHSTVPSRPIGSTHKGKVQQLMTSCRHSHGMD